MTTPSSRALRTLATACAVTALALSTGAVFAQTGVGGSSPTTGTSPRGESGSPSAPTVQRDPGSSAYTTSQRGAMRMDGSYPAVTSDNVPSALSARTGSGAGPVSRGESGSGQTSSGTPSTK
jgi:hypothetical protein